MLDSIRTLNDLPASSDARLAGEDLRAARLRSALQQQARRRAHDCVKQARSEAEAIRAQAYQEGYASGMVQAVEDLTRGLLESQTLGMQLREELAQAARQLLGDALTRVEWLDEMLERWLAEQADVEAPLQVLLPVRCQSRHPALRQRIQDVWPGALVIDYQPEERYVFRLAGQLLEFDIGATCERLQPLLLAQLANLPESARQLDDASISRLHALYTQVGQVRDED
ncbi:oxygen-regulated invasion protein OrgB [Pseudomonas fluorescens]|uniref:oxygen-regulated invasion protein OrgB n=1 Tax=Pseudomonas fluorescens TaxID=294 RepID=UPI003525E807